MKNYKKFILGKKIGMTQIFGPDGDLIPATVIEAGPVFVVGKKTKEKDNYEAVQVGFDIKKKINKPMKGFLKDLNNFRWIKEFRTDQKFDIGAKIDVSIFTIGDLVNVNGIMKGRGFQGVVKRHKFKGGPATHGHKHNLRAPGSIGSTTPEHVIKGKKMPGHMGVKNVTVRNLKVLEIDSENNLLVLKGAVPGAKGGLLKIMA